jgi:hypothetical protein
MYMDVLFLQVMKSGIVFATDIDIDISSHAIPKCLLFWGIAWILTYSLVFGDIL